MNRERFRNEKQKLLELIKINLNETTLDKNDKQALTVLLPILEDYTFDNRLSMKGLLSRTIVDSLNLSDLLSGRFFYFEESIL